MKLLRLLPPAIAAALALLPASGARAHPLGNFSVNRWAAIETRDRAIRVAYVVDFAEIPTVQEAPAIDADGDGRESREEIARFASRRTAELASGLLLEAGGERIPLRPLRSALAFSPGAGGLRTLKLTALYEGALPGRVSGPGFQVDFRDANFAGRVGWREIIAYGEGATAVVEANVPALDRSHALASYPKNLLQSPPRVSRAAFRMLTGRAAARAKAAGLAAVPRRDAAAPAPRGALGDRFTRLMQPSSEEFGLALLVAAFSGAFFWGAVHALSPGHGKTVVAAYLVGQRGTPLHAVWLGLLVTVTHTIGVFALGALTLALSHRFVPDAIYPWLGFASGLTVFTMGAVLLYRRARRALAPASSEREREHARLHAEGTAHAHDHAHGHHGPGGHTHAIPERLDVRGLVALGVSGGIVPCPSALVVLLSAIALHRVLFGMALILAFSVGLAAVLVAVGLLMVYARGIFDRFDSRGTLAVRLGAFSAAAIAALGIAIAARSIPAPLLDAARALAGSPLAAAGGVLGLGFLLGVKHATEVDHVAAVSTIVSEQGSLRRALWTGGLWGAGHTVSILLAGLAVLGLHFAIPATVARILELAVAVMIIALGSRALALALRGREDAHAHRHAHGGREHAHLHFHDAPDRHAPGAMRPPAHEIHGSRRIGFRPLLVGMVHGLAGSAALTLLVLAHIGSAALGLLYLLVFGIGSIGGMMLMSVAIGLPFAVTKSRPALHRGIRLAAGALSLGFGVFYAWSQMGGAG